jgi:alpha-galactosidase
VDGKKAFESGPMDRTMAAKPVEVDVSGAKVLELRALDGGDGITSDHADWANARLVK